MSASSKGILGSFEVRARLGKINSVQGLFILFHSLNHWIAVVVIHKAQCASAGRATISEASPKVPRKRLLEYNETPAGDVGAIGYTEDNEDQFCSACRLGRD
jgi:hypothetical protein